MWTSVSVLALLSSHIAVAQHVVPAGLPPPAAIAGVVVSDISGAAVPVSMSRSTTDAWTAVLWGLNGGTITNTVPITLDSNGNVSPGAQAGAGGMITLNDALIITRGTNSPGVRADDGGTITMNGGSITTLSFLSPGAEAQGTGTVTLHGVAISANYPSGGLSPGVLAWDGGTIALDGGSVTALGADAIASSGQGSTVTAGGGAAGGVVITAAGAGTVGAFAQDHGAIFIHGGIVAAGSSSVPGAFGVQAMGGGSQITVDGGTQITSSGTGAYATVGGLISLDNVAIREELATGAVPALYADNISSTTVVSTITANNVSVTTSGDGSHGALSTAGAYINVQNSTLTTSGTGAFGLHASNGQFVGSNSVLSRIDASNVDVTTTGFVGHGVFASNGALINLNTVNVTTSGDTAWGLNVEGSSPYGRSIQTEIDGTNVTVRTSGDGSYGAIVTGSGVLDLTDSTISATGAVSTLTEVAAGGVFVGDPGSLATLLRTTVTSNQYDAGRVADSAHLIAIDSVLTGGRHGVSSIGGTDADPNVISVSGGSLTAKGGDAFNAQDTIAQIALMNGTAVTTSSGNLLNVISTDPATFTSNVTFNVQAITAAGNIIADDASIATVNLTNGTTITGIQQNTFTTVDASSTWIMNGSSDIHSLTLAGRALFTPPTGDPTQFASYKTLTVGNYVGQGGTIGLNTYLGTDGSPSDLLIINGGAATGHSFLSITNTGGLGALTNGNGILVVDTINGGTTDAGAFALSGRVAAGAFDYSLFRGGVGADAGSDNWYLRSAGVRPEVPVDNAVPALAARLGLAMLGTLNDRTGNLGQFCADDVEIRKPDLYTKARRPNVQCNTLLWGRVFGETGSAVTGVGSSSGVGIPGAAYSFDYGGFQTGADLYRTALDNAGLYAGVATLQSDVRTANGIPGNRIGMDAYGVGGYWTHRSPSGWYTDLVLQGDWYENIHTQSVAGQSFNTHGWGITASAETGYAFALGSGYSVTPQAQAIYQRTNIDGGADQFGRISFAATDEVYGRLGARFARDWLTNDGRKVTTWAETNIWHQFGADAKTTFATLEGNDPTTFAASLGGTWAQIKLGLSGQLTRNVSVFGTIDYNVALSQAGHSIGGRAGVKFAW